MQASQGQPEAGPLEEKGSLYEISVSGISPLAQLLKRMRTLYFSPNFFRKLEETRKLVR